MARQNIDEKWKSDPRRTALAKRIGGRAADGMRVEVNWLILDHRGAPIPAKEFEFIENAKDWIECGLAEVKDDGVYVTGADMYAEWFEKQKSNSAKGGAAMKAKAAQRSQEKPKLSPKSPSSSSSFSLSSSSSKEIINYSSSKAGGEKNVDNPGALCLRAVQRYGPDEIDLLRTFVGDQLFERVRQTCGWLAVREMKRDSFAVINLNREIGSAP